MSPASRDGEVISAGKQDPEFKELYVPSLLKVYSSSHKQRIWKQGRKECLRKISKAGRGEISVSHTNSLAIFKVQSFSLLITSYLRLQSLQRYKTPSIVTIV